MIMFSSILEWIDKCSVFSQGNTTEQSVEMTVHSTTVFNDMDASHKHISHASLTGLRLPPTGQMRDEKLILFIYIKSTAITGLANAS